MATFSETLDADGRLHNIAATGDLDATDAAGLTALGLAALHNHTATTLTLDLGAVTFIDSSGIAVLVRLRNTSIDEHKAFRLERIPERIRCVLAITALDTVFTEHEPAVSASPTPR